MSKTLGRLSIPSLGLLAVGSSIGFVAPRKRQPLVRLRDRRSQALLLLATTGSATPTESPGPALGIGCSARNVVTFGFDARRAHEYGP
jgi:hypothetical protein